MHALATRLSLPAAALVAAGVVTVTPAVAPPPALSVAAPPVLHSVQLPDIQLAATVADILEFPALKQWVRNQVVDAATLAVGWAKAGEGVGMTLRGAPEFARTLLQQVFAGDLLGALTTIEEGFAGAVTAIGGPLLVSLIERNQRSLAVDLAMQEAVPAALIGLGTALVAGFDDVARSVIIAGQNVVDSLLPINLGNVINALVDGVKLIAQGLGEGAGKIVDGIVFAQQTIATALAAQPPNTLAAPTAKAAGAAALSVSTPPSTADTTVVTLKTATDITGSSASSPSGLSTPSATADPTPTAAPTPSATATPSATPSPTAPKAADDVTKTGNKFEPGSKVSDVETSTGSDESTSTPTTGTSGAPTTTTTTGEAASGDTTSAGTTGHAEAPSRQDGGAAAA
ncbi:hypothetical telomeric SfiI 20 protein 3 [Mycolicibacterium canariasense]|uniref:Hypothetical telomeric SfiI 20 protein 3 n=1 Tax=Mycolicibacterium canariasense TaxID=228230 RepID=A0A117IBH0_MYCCR|nr:hypothetical protein [Mycolicibacterium canariasense]MCV7209909.1 hypothetical protein [Mycolicibacterium canariasense]ORV13883.1 hypothetical protein AWB94_04655 [Mycolicibacterium canariasense]GAS97922.1 hypothetical telomeric SfiI 20 protein 3 [Mycolicibacterium canariasense]